MGATCWPDVPARGCQECKGLPRPRTNQEGKAWRIQGTLLSASPQVVCKDVGGPSQPLLWFSPCVRPAPASVCLRLRVSGAPSRALLPPLQHLNLVRVEGVRGGAAASARPPAVPTPHPPPASAAAPSRSSAPPRWQSSSSCQRMRHPSEGVCGAGPFPLRPRPSRPCPLTPAAPPSVAEQSVEIAPPA